MKRVIQKFGGTSVATNESRKSVIDKIVKLKNTGEFPIVVVSAIGRKGAPYATDTLIDFVTTNAGEMENREYDLLVSCGEIISAVTVATLLREQGINAVALTGGQSGLVTDNNYTNSNLLYTKPERIEKYIEEGIVPVVAGFQGMSAEGQITTFGRGGSDTTASMLGAMLKASRVEIYTDVDGIMTADPRVCEKAQIIPSISYNEIFQMADSGAKVIHPRAVEYAMRANIPMVIKNTFSEHPGTLITQYTRDGEEQEPKVLTGIAHRLERVQFTIQDNMGNTQDILNQIAQADISIDLINIFPTYKVFTINNNNKKKLKDLLDSRSYQYEVIEDCCKITAIGERMTGVPGVMATIVGALAKAEIEILQTADSLTTIACLIKEKDLKKAITVLHEAFTL